VGDNYVVGGWRVWVGRIVESEIEKRRGVVGTERGLLVGGEIGGGWGVLWRIGGCGGRGCLKGWF